MPRSTQPRRHPFGVANREAVDDPGARHLRQLVRQPGQASGRLGERDDGEGQPFPPERAPFDDEIVSELGDDVGDDPVVGGGGRAQHGHRRRKEVDDALDAAVVGPEVVTPVGDAVRLVDDQKSDGPCQRGKDLGAEAGVVETLRGHQQEVDLVGVDALLDLHPLAAVVAVDGLGPHPRSRRHLELVPHQGQQWRHEQRRARAAIAEEAGRDEVHRALAPPRPLHDKHLGPLGNQVLDGLPLARTERGGLPAGQLAEKALRLGTGVHGRQRTDAR